MIEVFMISASKVQTTGEGIGTFNGRVYYSEDEQYVNTPEVCTHYNSYNDAVANLTAASEAMGEPYVQVEKFFKI